MEQSNPDIAAHPSVAPEFVVGVTGHRDIADADLEGFRAALQTELKKINDQFSHLPVRVITGLAEGADTIATETALQMGIKTTAVLPMPVSEYQKDFSGAARARFDELVADSRVEVVEIPLLSEASDDLDRDAQYALLGDYLVRRSNVLVAAWDGEITGLPGGTSEVVFRYLGDGRTQSLTEIFNDGRGSDGCGNLVAWIPVGRASQETKPTRDRSTYMVSNANYDCYWLTDNPPDPFQTRWRGFDEFCVERSSDQGADLPAYGLGDADDNDQSAILAGLNTEFIRADQIARSYQTRSQFMFALFGLLAAAMGLAFLIYAKLLADRNLLFVYIGLFAAGFLGFRYASRLHLHSKHLAYRALAETFRVQYFLVLSGAGANYNPRQILGLTSVDQFQRFEWLQEVIRTSEPVVYFGHGNADEVLEAVNRNWIGDQLAYFEKKQHALHHQHHRLETIKFALLIGSVVGALALIFFKKSLIHLEMVGYDGKAWLVFFMGLLPLWAAVWGLYQGKMATRELLWQYSNQTRYFRAASHEIQQIKNLEEGQKIIRDLADKALIEIYMWSVHRFHREHEPPAAG